MAPWLLAGLAQAAPVAQPTAQPTALPVARADALDEPVEAELEAARRLESRRCGPAVGFLWPGASRFCLGRPAEGAVLGGLAAGELAAGIAFLGHEVGPADGGPALPVLGFQNLYVTGIALTAFDLQRARRKPYTPLDTFPELVSAPFRPRVLAKPAVWLGTGLLLGGAVGLTLALEEPVIDRDARPNVLGLDLPPGLGYPLAAGVDAATFLHVAVGEEVLFRGVIQSALTRGLDPTAGWLLGSLIFGAVHAQNALALPADERVSYLVVSVPYITVAGGVMGGAYRAYGYSLQPPVAIHFWYDAVLTGMAFAFDPDDNPLSARIAFRF